MPAFPHRPHYTYEDYCQWEGKWELWHGHAVSMSPSPLLPHGLISSRIIQAIANQLDGNDACGECTVVNEIDWVMRDDLTLKPDVSVLCHDLDAAFITHPPRIIVEVLSASTHLRDRNEKKDLYREHGVGRYLLADPKDWSLKDPALEVQPERHRIDVHEGCTIELPSDWTPRPRRG